MDTSKNSAYAAPNSPIASSKRARTKSEIKANTTSPRATGGAGTPQSVSKSTVMTSPTAGGKTSATAIKKTPNAALDNPSAEETTAEPIATSDSGATIPVPPTPSKIMFSPGLRTGANGQPLASTSSDSHDAEHDGQSSMRGSASASIPVSPCASSDNTHVEVDNTQDTFDDEEEDEEEDDDDYDDDVFNPYQFIAGLPTHATVKCPNKIVLPPLPADHPPDKLTLVLDLDETLVHCTVDPVENPDLIFPVDFNGTNYQVYVRKRPYLDHFLESVSKQFEVVLFTASQKVYADVLMNQIDPRKWVNHRLFRESCLLVQGNYLKDLTVLGRDLKKTMLVDNSPHAYGYQIDNGIPIESWYDDPNDTELLKLIGFLKRVQGVDDVKPVIHEHFKTFRLVNDSAAGKRVDISTPPF